MKKLERRDLYLLGLSEKSLNIYSDSCYEVFEENNNYIVKINNDVVIATADIHVLDDFYAMNDEL